MFKRCCHHRAPTEGWPHPASNIFTSIRETVTFVHCYVSILKLSLKYSTLSHILIILFNLSRNEIQECIGSFPVSLHISPEPVVEHVGTLTFTAKYAAASNKIAVVVPTVIRDVHLTKCTFSFDSAHFMPPSDASVIKVEFG